MDWKKITTWEFDDFQSWLRDLDSQECWWHEWKKIINLENQRIRNTFCAYANTNGGIIIFGVDDSKNIIGVGKVTDLRTKISRIINANILPAISDNGWDIKTFKIPRKRMLFVYCVYIFPSPYFVRPHITEHKIYKRGNGENIPIHDGNEIREKFLINKFDPKNIGDLQRDLTKINNARFNPDHIDVLYLKSLKGYLEDRSLGRNPEFMALSCSLTEIANLYEGIKKKQAVGITNGDNLGVLDNSSVLEDCNQLASKITDFLTKYEQAHQT
ncbi:MAG: ATP-binding protein [Parcubacteria group bacterium]|jgi:hypothetical protein